MGFTKPEQPMASEGELMAPRPTALSGGQDAEPAQKPNQQSGVDERALLERTAQLTAHRGCCGTEHDPANGKLHGYCVVCGVPWPCEYAGTPPPDLPQQRDDGHSVSLAALVERINGLERELADRTADYLRRHHDAVDRWEALLSVRRIAHEAFAEWDRDNDSRIGKILGALAGKRGYRADIDAIHDVTDAPTALSSANDPAVRAGAIEECAVVCDRRAAFHREQIAKGQPSDSVKGAIEACILACEFLAAAIRALPTNPDPTSMGEHTGGEREGWVLVPREPMEEMIQAAMPVAFIGHPEASEESKARWFRSHRLSLIANYKAMIDAMLRTLETGGKG